MSRTTTFDRAGARATRRINQRAGRRLAQLAPRHTRRGVKTTLGAITDTLEQRLIVEFVGEVGGKRLLDAGCGDGLLVSALTRRGAYAVGIDADFRMLVAAESRATHAEGRRAFVEGRLEKLPFPDAVFDVVVAVTVLCFVSDPSLVLREAVRVLRPGGRLVIGELGRWNVWAARRRIRAWLGSQTWKAARFRTASELRSLVEQAGIAVTGARGAVYYPPLGWIARILAPADPWLGRLTTSGAAFIALVGTKGNAPTDAPQTDSSERRSDPRPEGVFGP